MISSGQESYEKPRQCVENQRHYSASEGPYIFPVVMLFCESWTIKKAECQRTNAFNCGAEEDT